MNGEERVIGRAALWSAILNIGGLLLLVGSLGYAVLTLQAYENGYRPPGSGPPIPTFTADEAAPVENAPVAASQPEPTAGTPPPEAQDAASGERIAELTGNLQDARGRLTEAEARNEMLQRRVAELEQQATAQVGSTSAAAAEVAQCRADMTGLQSRHERLVERMQRGTAQLRERLQACLARPEPPPPPIG